jgi:glycosyltransferase involved in cell wall biosynthesis
MEYSNLIALISKKVSWVKPSILISEHTYNNSCLDQRKRKLKTLLMKKFYPKTDKMITVSKAIAENLIKSHEISQEKIKVIYNGIDLKNIEKKIKEGDLFKIDKKPLTIVACGRLTYAKNYSLLLRSFAEVQKRIKVKLLILGQGEEKESLESLGKSLGNKIM